MSESEEDVYITPVKKMKATNNFTKMQVVFVHVV